MRLARRTLIFAVLFALAWSTAAVAQSRISHPNLPVVQPAINAKSDVFPTNSVGLGSWTPLVELKGPPEAGDFGQSVATDGETGVVGSYGNLGGTGAAYVYLKQSHVPAKLTASDGQPGDLFGYSISISGNTIVVGATSANSSRGKAYVFVKPPTGWADMTETAQLTASDGQANDKFGTSVSISGNSLVVGAPNHTVGSNQYQGVSYVFVKPVSGWDDMTQTAELTASDGAANSELASSVSISGNTAVASASLSGRGAVYVFEEPMGGWVNMTQTARLADFDDPEINSVSISGIVIATGSAYSKPANAGAAHVYVRAGRIWKSTDKPTATLSPSDGNAEAEFGYSVSTNGSSVLVGAPHAFENGIAYAFSEPSGGWVDTTQTQELTASDGRLGGEFGICVSAGSAAVLVGAGTDTAYVFRYASNAGFTELIPAGSTWSVVSGINNVGQIVGYSSLGSFVDTNGMFTTVQYPGAAGTAAYGINSAGEVAGSYTDDVNVNHGFTELNGSYASFDYPGATGTYFSGIDDAGDLVGNYWLENGPIQGFLYSDGIFTPINVPGAQETVAFAINNSGTIAGFYCIAPCTTVISGFLYNNGAFTTVNYPGAASTSLTGINDNGDLVGVWSTALAPGGSFAFWNQSQKFDSFNLVGIGNTYAKGINKSGEIVGYFEVGGEIEYGFYGHLPGH